MDTTSEIRLRHDRKQSIDKEVHLETSESLISRDGGKVSTSTLDCMTLLSYHEAPSYLQFNPYILSGYRGYLSTKMCFESMFWMTNETINIWSHVFGWMLFLGLTLYDLLLLNIHASFTDKFIVGMLLACFQYCYMLSSAVSELSYITMKFATWCVIIQQKKACQQANSQGLVHKGVTKVPAKGSASPYLGVYGAS
ncbi:Progestin and adipoQ receptor member 3 [Homalodisca vitripennis]|nr:Progestin and adipoQ receptor member 3 [Homalodisca vitripennis]